jgi:predicted O-methyltransferase YrrM
MAYELAIAWRTLKKEGMGSFLNKVRLYLGQMVRAVRFCSLKQPRDGTPEQVVDFSTNAADGLLLLGQVRSEIVQLATLVREREPKTIVEIGTASGGTLFIWCAMASPEATVISLDLPGGIHGGGYPYWKSWLYRRFSGPMQKMHLLRGNSHEQVMLEKLKAILAGRQIDFLFIDGDHTYSGVKQDYEMYSPLVRPGGIIVFHDICVHRAELNCQVDRFWREVKVGAKNPVEFVENPQQGNCGIGVLTKS